MELTRREALAALGATAVSATAAGAATYSGIGNRNARAASTLEALAETVYPSEVTVEREFVRTYLGGRSGDARIDAGALAATLDDHAARERGFSFADLDVDAREAFLRDIGVATVPANPDGTAIERLHYLVNDLLLGLYAAPMGGRLLGNPNPTGHPGGTDHYQRGPE